MKALAILAALMATAMTLAQTTAASATTTYNKLWSGSNVVTINGTVTGKLVSPPLTGVEDTVALMVKQKDKEPYEVHLGPYWFVNRMPVQVNVGDKILVSGSKVTLNGRSVIMAESITKGKTQVLFRNRNGTPRWIGVIAEPLPTNTEIANGTLVATETTMINGVEHQLFRVETGQGTVDIVGAPTWYVQRQNYALNIGSGIQIVGAMRLVPAANNLYIADAIYSSGSTIVLRPFGY